MQNLHWGSASWETCSTMCWEDSTTTLGTCLGERDALRVVKGDLVDDLESETESGEEKSVALILVANSNSSNSCSIYMVGFISVQNSVKWLDFSVEKTLLFATRGFSSLLISRTFPNFLIEMFHN